MELRIPTRHLPNHTNRHRSATSYTLHSRHCPSLLLRSTHMPGRPIRMINPQHPRKRSFPILHMHLLPHRPRNLLRLIPKQRDLKRRRYPFTRPHSNSLRRIRSSLRTNIVLRSNRDHKSIFRNPLHRTNTSRMSMRRILSRQPNTNPILCHSLPPSLRHCRTYSGPPHPITRNRIKQPPRNPLGLRQNPISPLLLHKRHPRICAPIHPSSFPSPIRPQPPRRPRKLHAS